MTPSNQPPLIQQSQPEEVHLIDYINVIRRRRMVFAIASLAVFIGVALYTFLSEPVYEASATLHIKEEKSKAGILGELALSGVSPIDSEIEIVKSRSNAEQVVKQLHLDWQVSKKSDGLAMKILEFSSSAKKPVYKIELTDSAAYTVKDDDGNLIGSGRSGVLLQGKGLMLLLTDLKGKKENSFRLELLPFNDTVAYLQKITTATEVGKKTNIIRLSYPSSDPVLARDVINALVQAYLNKTVALMAEEASRTVSFVEDQLKVIRDELNGAEKNLQEYKSASGVVQLDAEATSLIGKLAEVETLKASVTLQKKQAEFALSSLNESRRRGTAYSPAPLGNDALDVGLATTLAGLEVQKRGLLNEYTVNHPLVKAVQNQIDEVQKKLQATYETSRRGLTGQEGNITRRLAGYEEMLKRLPEKERDLVRLARLTKVNADIYTFLLQKHEEARIAMASTISNINIVDPAIIPDHPIKPRKAKNLLLGLLVGCLLGGGLVFFQEYLDDTIKDGEEAKRLLGWPLLGIIPHIATDKSEGERSNANLVSHQKPTSPAAEAFRSLRTGLHFVSARRKHKVLMVTSTFPGEGKTTTSANLSEILSQTGATVLLVGCDLRRPTLHEIFGFDKVPGLTELLAGDTELQEALHQTGIQKLDFINAGTIPPNPAELLGSEQMARLIDQLRERYDYIVLDAPPILAVSDAPILVPCCDAVIVLIEAGRVPVKAAQRVREILASVDAPVAGIVINDKNGRAEGYGYGYSYGYGYGYGEKDESKVKKSWRQRLFKSKT